MAPKKMVFAWDTYREFSLVTLTNSYWNLLKTNMAKQDIPMVFELEVKMRLGENDRLLNWERDIVTFFFLVLRIA